MKSLNPAHLKALLGQEVSMTLSDGSTRQGTVYSLDPESFTIVLATPTSVRGGVGSNAWKNGEDHRGDPDACVVVPGHAVASKVACDAEDDRTGRPRAGWTCCRLLNATPQL